MDRVVNLSVSILTRSLRLVDRIIPVRSPITVIPIIADLGHSVQCIHREEFYTAVSILQDCPS